MFSPTTRHTMPQEFARNLKTEGLDREWSVLTLSSQYQLPSTFPASIILYTYYCLAKFRQNTVIYTIVYEKSNLNFCNKMKQESKKF